MIKATFPLDGLLEAVEIERPLVNTWKPIKIVAMLFVEFGKLIEVIVVDSVSAFDRVEFLTSGAEVETLFRRQVSPNHYIELYAHPFTDHVPQY